MSNTAIIAIVVGIVVVVILLRDQIKTLSIKWLGGGAMKVTTHKPSDAPTAGAHMTDVKARDATVRDETGQVATMTGVEAERDTTVTTTGPPKETPHPKKAPPPGH